MPPPIRKPHLRTVVPSGAVALCLTSLIGMDKQEKTAPGGRWKAGSMGPGMQQEQREMQDGKRRESERGWMDGWYEGRVCSV